MSDSIVLGRFAGFARLRGRLPSPTPGGFAKETGTFSLSKRPCFRAYMMLRHRRPGPLS